MSGMVSNRLARALAKAIAWENSKEDFEFLGYERYDCGPPKSLQKALHASR